MADARARAGAWASLDDGARRRGAVEAARDHDAAVLWELTQTWLILNIDEITDNVRPVHRGALRRHADLPPAPERFAGHKQVGRAVAHVLTVLFDRLPGADRLRRTQGVEQLHAGLVQAHLRRARVVGPLVHLQDVLHLRHEGGVGLRCDVPTLL